MADDDLPAWLSELDGLRPEAIPAAAPGGRWLVPHLQVGPRKAHYVLTSGPIRSILLLQ